MSTAFITRKRTPWRPALRGFTLVELLVVITIVGILVAMMLPSLGAARAQARRTMCASGLRQFGIMLTSYAQEHNGYYPGDKLLYWHYDSLVEGGLPTYIRKDVRGWIANTYQVPRTSWFCPSHPARDALMNNWNGDVWPGTPTDYGILGYMMLSHLEPTGSTSVQPPYAPRHVDSAKPEWELMADIVGWKTAFPFLTGNAAHVDAHGQPEGGNILHVGGHVTWRRFDDYDTTTYTRVNTFWHWYAW